MEHAIVNDHPLLLLEILSQLCMFKEPSKQYSIDDRPLNFHSSWQHWLLEVAVKLISVRIKPCFTSLEILPAFYFFSKTPAQLQQGIRGSISDELMEGGQKLVNCIKWHMRVMIVLFIVRQ